MKAEVIKFKRFWYNLGLTQKFGLIFGILLLLIVLLTGVHFRIMKTSYENTVSQLTTSTLIQELVLEMDAGLERARRLKKEFSLEYDGFAVFDPTDDYAARIQSQLLWVSGLSDRLRAVIQASNVSQALRNSHINLNLYFSMATRCDSAFKEMLTLVTELNQKDTGLLYRFGATTRTLTDLISSSGNLHLISLFQSCRLHAQSYIITRERPVMQTVLNSSFFLKKAVLRDTGISSVIKDRLLELITQYTRIAEQIPDIDIKIQKKSNEFDLNTETLESVSTDLIRLVNTEINATRSRSHDTVRFLGLILVLTAMAGVGLVAFLAFIIHRTITRHIKGMTHVAAQIQSGDFSIRWPLSSNDELGRLSIGLNQMAARLKGLIEDLENQVRDRTRDLEQTNRSLEKEILEKEKLANELRQAHKMEAVGTLSGGIAHDFNNILGIILGNTELADDDIPDWNPAKDNLKEIRTACFRAKEVVQQLLSFSRETPHSFRPLKPALIIRESMSLIRASIPSTIDIRQDIPDTGHTIMADPTQIHQVILNLCSNAAHAMEHTGGTLTIMLEDVVLNDKTAAPDLTPGDYACLTVADTGSGIDPLIMDKIFDPYFTTKDTGKGTGMGLAVVHGIVAAHHGSIRIETENGKKTRFILLFPAVSDPVAEDTSKNIASPVQGHGHILIVDDEPGLVTLAEKNLQRLGYTGDGFTDPTEALEMFRSDPGRYDLVLTDMTMPGMTGQELARFIKAVQRDIPLVICTGHHDRLTPDNAAEYGFSAYLSKPVDKAELARVLSRLLANEN